MSWPSSQDYNEAVQDPPNTFADPDLRRGRVVVNALGLPAPRSGTFADVYQFRAAGGRQWAVKCFTRPVPDLRERYARIDEHLARARLPFTVGFRFLPEGILVRGRWYPVLRMEWVEGFVLNDFVAANADRPEHLHALVGVWARLAGRLRDARVAHGDLQHGNVLLVPGATPQRLGLRLVDYDGMWVPALAGRPSDEVGHPNFQHPARLTDRLFNADVDRFSHLVVAAALRATMVGGRPLWDRFDNGDNLLFKAADFRDPGNSLLFQELWGLDDPVLRALVGHLALAAAGPPDRTPWLDHLLLDTGGPGLSTDELRYVCSLLGEARPATGPRGDALALVSDWFRGFDVVGEADPGYELADEPADDAPPPPPPGVAARTPALARQKRLTRLVGLGVLGLCVTAVVVVALALGALSRQRPTRPSPGVPLANGATPAEAGTAAAPLANGATPAEAGTAAAPRPAPARPPVTIDPVGDVRLVAGGPGQFVVVQVNGVESAADFRVGLGEAPEGVVATPVALDPHTGRAVLVVSARADARPGGWMRASVVAYVGAAEQRREFRVTVAAPGSDGPSGDEAPPAGTHWTLADGVTIGEARYRAGNLAALRPPDDVPPRPADGTLTVKFRSQLANDPRAAAARAAGLLMVVRNRVIAPSAQRTVPAGPDAEIQATFPTRWLSGPLAVDFFIGTDDLDGPKVFSSIVRYSIDFGQVVPLGPSGLRGIALKCSDPVEIHLQRGADDVATTQDNRVSLTVSDGILTVGSAGDDKGAGLKSARIDVRTSRFKFPQSIAHAGNGSVELEGVDADELTVEISGTGTLLVEGKARALRLKVTGNGSFLGRKLAAETGLVWLSPGARGVVVNVSKSLSPFTAGAAVVEYVDHPDLKFSAGAGNKRPANK